MMGTTTTTTPALSHITMNLASVNDISQAYPDLTPEEQQVLLNIRKRKDELLNEIYQLKEELINQDWNFIRKQTRDIPPKLPDDDDGPIIKLTDEFDFF